ncbi:glycosyltransferase [Jatrophihabitans endophyticus]|uniref:bifunctional glycosyltransferase/CDP-glycerol:glycerophosphate glycerophosphotransferase n=1 Tax=Jatrophihabitans endophyticus TaxID=1206085 RepID=UPI0019F7E629|nr:glycosyltransferase [Jatrophihabitans endophyticus]MBE7187920.1 glycosyltransferase [Jatrophihabitans endophyticus]
MPTGTGSISVVVPTYGVAAYLPAFLASLDAQDLAGRPVEVVFVDDGSPDDSAAIISAWIAERPGVDARLVRKANGGLSSARNAGLDVATGDWVSFPDPDDVLDAGYLDAVSGFLASPEADTVHLVTGRPIFYDDPVDGAAEGRRRDTHPLRHRFDDGTRVVDLVRYPQYFHVAANTGFFRRALLAEHALRFDGGVRPVWEDGHLTARYLSPFERPRVAVLAEARYLYRVRADRSSLMDGQWSDPDKFVTVPGKGWLDALRTAAAEHDGRVPEWLQNMIVYDVRGYFKNERRDPSPTAAIPREVSDEFLRLLHACFEYLDLDVLDRFRGSHITHEVREVLRMVFAGAPDRPAEIAVDRLDEGRGLVRLRYYYAGEPPVEQWRARGLVVAPVFEKTRPCRFYGRDLAYERLVWLPADGILSVTLDGRAVALRTGPPELRRLDLRPTRIREALASPPPVTPPPARPGLRPRLGRVRRDVQQQLHDARATAGQHRLDEQARAYTDAWLLSDHPDRAGGDAEVLYRWLRAHRPQVNAWFVLAASAPDRSRLSADGFRLIEPGSDEHDLARRQARHIVSAHPDGGDDRALRILLPAQVITRDVSNELNRAALDLVLCASPGEFDAVVGDTSPYVWGRHEVALTGLPRHDRLLDLARRAEAAGGPTVVLLAPSTDDLPDAWRALLDSDDLRRAADAHGYRVEHARPTRPGDVERLLAEAVVVVTDDAAVSFEAALLQRAVVYLEPGVATPPPGRPGWWDVERDGFGPVTPDAGAALAAVTALLTSGGTPEAPYAERMAGAFAFRDGENCRRVHDAITALTTPLTEDERYLTLEPRDVIEGRPVVDGAGR